jgi:DNA sulfur modification protein DndB
VKNEAGYAYTFPAVRGMQAGQPFYIAMCPARVVPKILNFDEEEVPPQLRAQRTLNRSRIPEISDYLIENPDSYILSALTASIDGRVSFESTSDKGAEANIGMLNIPMDVQILINDGQHRRAAIEEAIKQRPEFGQENIPILFFLDQGLKRSQQMFADLNKYAIRPSTSLGALYDHRDPASGLARYIAMSVEPYVGLTELEKSSIPMRSNKLFTLSGIKYASRALLQKGAKDSISEDESKLAAEFWKHVGQNMPDWILVREKKVVASELRQQFIHTHGIVLHALGNVGAYLLATEPKSWKHTLEKLPTVDWDRSNTDLWEGRAMIHGRISKARSNILLTGNVIKRALGIDLTGEEQALENKIG